MSLPFALLLFLLTSNDDEDVRKHLQSHKQKLKNLDLTGVTLLTEWFITLGNILMIGAMILFCFAEAPDKYWRFGFTGLGIGSAGAMLAYAH
ncbi:hypothetical protein PHLGIDRAFT_120104 [Phlebiopsis gigantea 11061_1 CR5-6]|uniref:Uncharacterized protein n=1 Tax=Phlebiopsis gigantea (strain 11061_1 CR5-6) TaxID=745531 RepID=A0A0C3RV85_PHLG1|nr:hypothetical protein PHLGIDRAFT_120104 [Phlebiopsis gigantea 11061_1 CR5-6]